MKAKELIERLQEFHPEMEIRMNKQIFYHPEECEHCQHFDSNTWNGTKPLIGYCFGFGGKRCVMRNEEAFNCPKFKQKRE